jgi:hypothetical protein
VTYVENPEKELGKSINHRSSDVRQPTNHHHHHADHEIVSNCYYEYEYLVPAARESVHFFCSLFLLRNNNTSTMKIFCLLAATLASTVDAFSAITPGTKLPSVELHSGFPPAMVDMAEHVAGRKVAIVGLPGAFTPT